MTQRTIAAATTAAAFPTRRRVFDSPEKLRILGDSAWLFAGQLASAAGLLLGMRLLTELVPPDVFGAVSLLIGLVTVGADIFCVPGLEAALRFYPDLARRGELARLRSSLTRSLLRTTGVLAVLMIVVGWAGRGRLGVSPWVFAGLACLLFAQVFRTFEGNFLIAARRVRTYVAATTAENLLRPGLAIAAVIVWGASFEAVLAGYFLGSFLVYVGLFLARRRFMQPEAEPVDPVARRVLDRDIRRFALPLMPLALAGWVCSVGDRYVIGGLVGPDAVGIYAAAYGIMSRPFLMLTGVLAVALKPVYFEAVSAENTAIAQKTLRTWLAATLGVSAIGVLGAVIFRHEIAGIFLADKYRASAELIPWIALGSALLAAASVVEKPLYAGKQTWRVTAVHLSSAAASLAVSAPLVWRYGVIGAAWAMPVYFGLQLGLSALAAARVRNDVRGAGIEVGRWRMEDGETPRAALP